MNATRQQAISWANVDPDLCRQIASLGLNELIKLHQSLLFCVIPKLVVWQSFGIFIWFSKCVLVLEKVVVLIQKWVGLFYLQN